MCEAASTGNLAMHVVTDAADSWTVHLQSLLACFVLIATARKQHHSVESHKHDCACYILLRVLVNAYDSGIKLR